MIPFIAFIPVKKDVPKLWIYKMRVFTFGSWEGGLAPASSIDENKLK